MASQWVRDTNAQLKATRNRTHQSKRDERIRAQARRVKSLVPVPTIGLETLSLDPYEGAKVDSTRSRSPKFNSARLIHDRSPRLVLGIGYHRESRLDDPPCAP
jgi:hypothetical protein